MSFSPAATSDHDRRSTGFLLVFALANVGGVIGYLPLLTLLLPLKIEGLAGDAHFGVFTATIVVGAIAASIANIAFGWASDRTLARGGERRGWVAGGVLATAISYAVIALAHTPAQIIVAVGLFQVAINMLLAPLFAIMADEIPDPQKGLTSGWLALANPVASGLSAVLVGLVLLGDGARFGVLGVAMVACTMPLLLARARAVGRRAAATIRPAVARRDLAIAWGSRMAVQVAGNVLALYLLYYFESLEPAMPHGTIAVRVGRLLAIAYALPLPVAVIAGRLSDRIGRRKPFLLAAAMVAAGGLVAMAIGGNWRLSAAGFALYAVGSAVFLALHAGFAMQLLPDPRHRGRDLGLINLTNTLPALIGPVLAWLLATPSNFAGLMVILAVLTFGGGLAILAIDGNR
ncbi:MFS transporter [Sphingomonas oligophenolica]|uniref:MFS transporter n=1 Tax=Sphingomonas oligophenolica TaxID=301154 RepID=A0A502CRN9_9SPHN|nr:MFS transporter [Sphingomonas oligophenolica]TPG15558.1 MFS transporter [Sphingomonas oligophenolica]